MGSGLRNQDWWTLGGLITPGLLASMLFQWAEVGKLKSVYNITSSNLTVVFLS